ncbi:hypothetical protein H2198_010227 [Neophaeococcomyces mojaviensis]|uniref:Uncharacterized protein n=1 Tax=Neophaeococcomyces mojaviensis TaxID=3383035 RepID=A0ACC2ZSA4_9EURO|nr:hypothetical protein H2198_010227 [Knufia sp. JES_112]
MSISQHSLIKPVPQGSWDTHLHIFEPDRYSFSNERHFTPAPATLEQLELFEKSVGIDHVCIAHGLSFGSDCTSLLAYLEYFKGKARGICVLDVEDVTDGMLNTYHAAGVRSVRIDFFKPKAMDDLDLQISLIQKTAQRLMLWGQHRWSIQIQQPHLEHWHKLAPLAAELSVPLVVDHFALFQAPSMRPDQIQSTDDDFAFEEMDGFEQLVAALRHGNTWIKLSAPYRCSDLFPNFDDLESLVRLLVRANRHRVVWGSDWPHTQRHKDRIGKSSCQQEAFLKIEDATWIKSLSRWMSEEEWNLMWIVNPSTLYY